MIRFRFSIPVLLLTATTLLAQTTVPTPPATPNTPHKGLPAAVTNRAILLVNAAGLPDEQMESIRAFAQKDLWVKVDTVNLKADWDSLPGQIPALFTSNRLVVVALAKGSPENARILTAPDNNWAIMNVTPFLLLKEKQEHMLKQQTLRSIGYVFGVSPCPDPYCCMKSSRALSDLNEVGQNYCPITRKEFSGLAPRKGFFAINPMRAQPVKKPAPAKPDAVPAKP